MAQFLLDKANKMKFKWDTFKVNDLTADGCPDTIEITLIAEDGEYVEVISSSLSILAESGENLPIEEWTREKCQILADKVATREKWEEQLRDKIEKRQKLDSRIIF